MEEDVRERDGKRTEGDGMSGEEGESMRECVCRRLYFASVYVSSISHAQYLFLPVAPFFPRPLSLSLSLSLPLSLPLCIFRQPVLSFHIMLSYYCYYQFLIASVLCLLRLSHPRSLSRRLTCRPPIVSCVFTCAQSLCIRISLCDWLRAVSDKHRSL